MADIIKNNSALQKSVDNLNIGQQEDWKFPATQQRRGLSSKPDFDFVNIGLLFPENDEAEISYMTDQRPHSMEDDTELQPHCHLVLTQAGTPKFTAMIRLTNSGDNEAAWIQYDMEVLTSNWVNGRHHVILHNPVLMSSVGKIKSAILDVKLFRQTADGYTGDVLLKSFDIHYYRSKLGENI